MRPTNRDGTPVDPVPFLVVTGVAFAVCASFGPMYAAAVGAALPVAVTLSAGAFAVATAGAYYALVWTARPDTRGEVAPRSRLERILVVTFVLVGGLALLALAIASP